MKPAWAQTSKGMTLLYRVVLFLTWLYFKIFHRHKIYGEEHFFKGAAIIAANHTSFLDPPILGISWPQEVHFLARESLFKHRLFGAFIRALNAHPVAGDTGDVAVFKTICQLLNEGKKIILFPEGTRSLDNQIQEIKPGIGLLVIRTQSAMIPAYIHGTYEVWGRFRRFPKLFGKTACVFGSAIRFSTFAHLEKRDAMQAMTSQLSSSIKELRKWYEAGAKGSPP